MDTASTFGSTRLYAQIADQRDEFASKVCDSLTSLLPDKRDLLQVRSTPFQSAPHGWQAKAKAFTGGRGLRIGTGAVTNIAGEEDEPAFVRSQRDINLYYALKKRGVVRPAARLRLRRRKLSADNLDFVVIKGGVFAVDEVDGDHSASKRRPPHRHD